MSVLRTIDFVTDLGGPAKVIQSGHVLIYSTDLRDRVRVQVTQGGEPVSLADQTISGAVMRSDGATVVSGFGIEKETEGTGITAIILPEAAYACTGTAYVVIQGSDSQGHPLTLLATQMRVAKITSDTIVDPGEVVPSVAELLAQIEACEAATEAAVDFLDGAESRIGALEDTAESHTSQIVTIAGQIGTLAVQMERINGVVAPTFSESQSYSAGDYVIWSSFLFRFTADHPAGPWNGTTTSDVTDAVLVTVGSELTDIRLTCTDDGYGNITFS